jgi:hypothetical protein
MRSDRKGRLITICVLAGAVVMIGLALTGTSANESVPLAGGSGRHKIIVP